MALWFATGLQATHSARSGGTTRRHDGWNDTVGAYDQVWVLGALGEGAIDDTSGLHGILIWVARRDDQPALGRPLVIRRVIHGPHTMTLDGHHVALCADCREAPDGTETVICGTSGPHRHDRTRVIHLADLAHGRQPVSDRYLASQLCP